jgi:hypothetical protein
VEVLKEVEEVVATWVAAAEFVVRLRVELEALMVGAAKAEGVA